MDFYTKLINDREREERLKKLNLRPHKLFEGIPEKKGNKKSNNSKTKNKNIKKKSKNGKTK